MAIKNNFERILVPFDGSKYSQKALQTAIEIARKFNSTLYLVTVIDISSVRPPGALLGSQKKSTQKSLDLIKSVAKHESRKMLSEKTDRCKKVGIDTNYDILEGETSDTILKFIKKSGIDFVVIGSQGLSGIGRIKALGSVSRRVSENATCPVLIIR